MGIPTVALNEGPQHYMYCRCGEGLKGLVQMVELQRFQKHSVALASKTIFQHGALRKVLVLIQRRIYDIYELTNCICRDRKSTCFQSVVLVCQMEVILHST